jgi:hypothetical protein
MTPADVPHEILLAFSDAESHCWGHPTHGLRYADCCRRAGLAAVLPLLQQQTEALLEAAHASVQRNLNAVRQGVAKLAASAQDAETALAELHAHREVQWATRTNGDGLPDRYHPDDEDTCRRRAALHYGEPHHLVQRDIFPSEWRDVSPGGA